MQSTVTLTFGDQVENHVGMQKIGKLADSGFDYNDLVQAKTKFEAIGCECELIDLIDKHLAKKYNATPAYVLVIRDAVNKLLDEGVDEMLKEQNGLVPDKKALMYGRVVNKNARYNLCFDEKGQKADYDNGKGTVVAYDKVPLLNKLRNKLSEYLGDKAKGLTIEGNYYHDNLCKTENYIKYNNILKHLVYYYIMSERAEYYKTYYKTNKQKWNEKHKCEICGSMYSYNSKYRHFKTKKHLLCEKDNQIKILQDQLINNNKN